MEVGGGEFLEEIKTSLGWMLCIYVKDAMNILYVSVKTMVKFMFISVLISLIQV